MSLFLHASNSYSRMANLHLQGSSYTGPIVVSSASETLDHVEYRRWLIENDYAAGQNAKWGMLTYNEVECVHTLMVVRGIKAEHAFYPHSPRGNHTFRGCIIQDCGAQGIQIAYRDPESDTPLGWQQTGVHLVEGCRIEKCGQPRGYGRAAFALTFFGRQEGDGSSPRKRWDCPAVVKDTHIVHDSAGAYELRGALHADNRPSLTVLGGSTVYKGLADRHVWTTGAVDEVIVDGHHFEASRMVDLDKVKKVEFTNCTTDPANPVILRVNGTKIGPVSQDFVWQA